MPPTSVTQVELWPRVVCGLSFSPSQPDSEGFSPGTPVLLKIDSQSITSGWFCGAARSHMDRMAVAVGASTCIRSDHVEPVDPEKPF